MTAKGQRFLGLAALVLLAQLADVSAKRPDFIDDDMMDMVMPDKQECMAEFGTTEDLIEKASEGNIANDKKLTCYMSCLMRKLGLMDDDGNIDTDMMLSVVPDELAPRAMQVLEKCSNFDGADLCEKMYNTAVCVSSNCPDMWFMI